MDVTPNIGLYLEDDAATKFKTWREKMNGSNDSNMVIIDTAFGTKADKSVQTAGTLLASGWVGDDAPYTQEVAIEGLGASQNGNIGLAHGATSAQRIAARAAMISVLTQDDGMLTLVADGDKPEVDIPFFITLIS